MPIFTRGLIASLTMTTLVIAVPATANLYSHPHGPSVKAPHKNAQTPPHAANLATNLARDTDVVDTDIVDVNIVEMNGSDISMSNPSSPDASDLDVRDFNIEDFIGADGQVDLEKLRAYENGEAVQDQFSGTQDTGLTDMAGSDNGSNDGPQIFRFDEEEQSLKPVPQQYSEEFYPQHNQPKATPQSSETSLNSSVNRAIDRLMNALKNENRTDNNTGDVTTVKKPRDVRVIKLDMRDKSENTGIVGRTISLSGETKIVIGDNGEITITNNGDAIVPLSMIGPENTQGSAMVIDDGKPAKISVQKTIEHINGKRHIHVEVDMEIDDIAIDDRKING